MEIMKPARAAARTFLNAVAVLLGIVIAIPLVLIIGPIVAVAGIFGGKREMEPSDLAIILRRIADDTIGDEWDDFECGGDLKDERLEAIRRRAFPFCGRPGIVDAIALRSLAEEAEALSPRAE